jgi:hypothetical protein
MPVASVTDIRSRVDQHGKANGTGTPPGSGGSGGDMEPRVAKLEASMEFIKDGITEIKSEVRSSRANFDTKIGVLGDRLGELKDSIHAAKVWAVLLYIAMAGGILFVVARGLKWI